MEAEAERGGRSWGGDLLEVLLVTLRGVGEVQWWCVLEGELGVPFYRRSEAVAVDG